MKGSKEKVTCYECGANYLVDLEKIPEAREYFKCIKCGEQVPILRRLVKGKAPPLVEEAPLREERPVPTQEAESYPLWSMEESWDHGGPGEEETEQGNWLATLADMFSILLIFFILMFAISSVDRKKFETVMQSINTALGGNLVFVHDAPPQEPAEPLKIDPNTLLDTLKQSVQTEKKSLSTLRRQLEDFIVGQQLLDKFTIADENTALSLIALDMLMFDSGSAEIREEVRPHLRKIAVILQRITNEIVVEGHTDDIPIRSARFSSNWELSVMRATNVIHFFVEECGLDASHVSAAGYAYYKPRYPMDSQDKAKNRRIEVLIKKKYTNDLVNEILIPE